MPSNNDSNSLLEVGEKVNSGKVGQRESRLMIINIIQFMIIIILVIGLLASLFLEKFEPSNTIVVDSKTGDLIGQYRTTSYRTDDEIKGATRKFIGCHLSLNNDSVYDDFACAISMMGEELRSERVAYLKKTDLAKRISKQKSSSSRIESIKTEILDRRNGKVYVETQGMLLLNNNTLLPFRMEITWLQIPISEHNTSGVLQLVRKEYEL